MRIVLDACVLYPPSLRDLLLTLASLEAFELRWSQEILEEFERNVLADHPEILPMLASWQLNEPINTPAAGPYGRDGNVEYETTP